MTEKDKELLNYISRNAKMGGDNLETLQGDITCERLKECVINQIGEYRYVEMQAKSKLASCGEEAEEAGAVTRFCCKTMINFKTLMDKSASHIAEMIIQGSTMGIIDITRQINDYSLCDGDALNLAYRLKCVEQKNLDEMKHFL